MRYMYFFVMLAVYKVRYEGIMQWVKNGRDHKKIISFQCPCHGQGCHSPYLLCWKLDELLGSELLLLIHSHGDLVEISLWSMWFNQNTGSQLVPVSHENWKWWCSLWCNLKNISRTVSLICCVQFISTSLFLCCHILTPKLSLLPLLKHYVTEALSATYSMPSHSDTFISWPVFMKL